MRFIVQIPELDLALYGQSGQKSRQELLRAVRKLELSGRLLDGGLLADDRGGVLLVEAASFTQAECFLSSIFDPARFTVEIHPLLPFNCLSELLEKLQAPGGPKARPSGKSRREKSLQTAAV